MATVTPRSPSFNRAEVDRRVRHPLQALRGSIRRYVTLEGVAVTVLYLSLCFWLGLAFDYGLFALLRFDWIKELDRASGETASFWVRGFILLIVVAGLVAVISLKVLRRLFREFSDRALALVLERRFPRELGDRLITAVEMADPKLSEKYGFSQVMLDRTIREAADRVEKLPVHEVFNWVRLRWQLIWAGIASVGVYLVVMLASCVTAAALGRSASPVDFFFEFNHITGTWIQRNILLQEHRYWLGNEYLEFVRFPGNDKGELRVARDEYRPEVYVRAVKWVFADRGPDAPEGWRPLRWSDLKDLLPADQLQVNLPANWPGWVIDLDDLDPRVPAGVIPAEWGWQNKTAGHIRKQLQERRVKEVLDSERARAVGAREAVERLLDWQTWTFDRIELQALERAEVRQAMKDGHMDAYNALEKIRTALKDLAESPRMRGTMRQLSVPATVTAHSRGKKTKSSTPLSKQDNYKFSFNLNELKESVDFYFSGNEYSTPSKKVTLVPPPIVARISLDKEEPAYIYYRLLGDDAGKLKGQRQRFRDVAAATDGSKTVIPVPLGSSLTVTATINRDLKPGTARVAEPAKRDEPGSLTPPASVTVHDARTFSTRFENVRRVVEFDFEFRDSDNVKGRRHMVIKPVVDEAPKLVGVRLPVTLRPDYDPESGKGGPGRSGERLLITPNARLPFHGRISDARGLSAVDFRYEVIPLAFQRIGEANVPEKKDEVLPLQGTPQTRRTGLVLSLFQFVPGDQGFGWFAPTYAAGIASLKKADLHGETPESGLIEMEFAQKRFSTTQPDDVSFEEMVRLLQIQPRNRPLAAKLLDLKGDKERADFVAEIKSGNQHEALLRDVLNFLKLDKAQRDVLRPLLAADPDRVVRDVLEIAKKDDEGRKNDIALLKKQPEQAIIREHSLDKEAGFDVRKYLPKVKALKGETQKHYELRLFVTATDNNVETGPTVAPPKGPFTFLIISENELIAEIIKQERKLYALLKEAVDNLEGRKTTLDAEMLKLGSPQPDFGLVYGLVSARADLAKKAVRETNDIARSVLEKYLLIAVELEVNRVEGDKLKKVRERIIDPLEELTNKSNGYGRIVDRNVTEFWDGVDRDLTRVRRAEQTKKVDDALLKELEDGRQIHGDKGKEASRQMDVLIRQLRQVLEAMQDTIEADKLIEMLVRIEAEQREAERILREHYRIWQEGTFEDLFGPKGKGPNSKEKK
jgi:hypothetical protein